MTPRQLVQTKLTMMRVPEPEIERWLNEPSSALEGAVPAEAVDEQLEPVLLAAHAFALDRQQHDR